MVGLPEPGLCSALDGVHYTTVLMVWGNGVGQRCDYTTYISLDDPSEM